MKISNRSKNNAGKSVLITGATSGIGRAIAISFAEQGWNVLCHYFSSQEKALQLKKEITAYNVDCDIFKVNLMQRVQVEKFIDKLQNYNIDTLINNAGTYNVNKDFTKLSFQDIAGTFIVNAIAPILLSASLFMRMKENNFGRIINISSIAAKYGGSSHSMHYGCSKLALEGLTKTLAREGAGYNVLVNTIRPGVIDTEFHKKFPKDMSKRIAMIPAKKMGSPNDIAEMAYFLGSEKNNFITNQIITISGGE